MSLLREKVDKRWRKQYIPDFSGSEFDSIAAQSKFKIAVSCEQDKDYISETVFIKWQVWSLQLLKYPQKLNKWVKITKNWKFRLELSLLNFAHNKFFCCLSRHVQACTGCFVQTWLFVQACTATGYSPLTNIHLGQPWNFHYRETWRVIRKNCRICSCAPIPRCATLAQAVQGGEGCHISLKQVFFLAADINGPRRSLSVHEQHLVAAKLRLSS